MSRLKMKMKNALILRTKESDNVVVGKLKTTSFYTFST